MPRISVVVLNWNGRKYLESCLSSIKNQSCRDFEIVFVDNASEDGSAEYVKKNFNGIKVIKNKKNLGFAKGNNIGIENSKGDYVLILNNDTEMDKNCLKELMNAAAKNPHTGMFAPKMLYSGTGKVDSTGLQVSKSGLSKDIKDVKADVKTRPFCPCGGAAFYKREMLEDIKLCRDYYDSDYFIYMEDYDLGFRARLRNWECIAVPKATVYHVHGATMKKEPDKSVYLGVRNRLFTIIKNYPSSLFAKYFFHIMLLQIAIFFRYLLKGKLFVILRAYYDFAKSLPKFIQKRKLIQKNRKITAKQLDKLLAGSVF